MSGLTPAQQLHDLESRIHAASVEGDLALASRLTMLYAETVLELAPATSPLASTPTSNHSAKHKNRE